MGWHPETFLEYFLTEDDSALEVALEIRFWGLVAYKMVACKKVYLQNISQ